ncbi:MAG: 2-oxoacid:acceptor oxidoreductase subunit alpha [Spirochaetae bacterium HGW-Spirochaetae-8]|nr:MAG: 2-oxoacid:acceptor oxidoreductase subunit alpha [Spirochaetae bacterium HGW-Spirochaetae-8]
MNDTSYSVVLSGEAGQGLKTIESLFMVLLQKSGYHAFLSKEFMSRVRGGNNTTEIRIAPVPVRAFIERIDLLVVLSGDGLQRLVDRIDAHTVVIGEKEDIEAIPTGAVLKSIPIASKMKELGNPIYANNLINGLLCGLFSCDESFAQTAIRERFQHKGAEIVDKNQVAFTMGVDLSRTLNLGIDVAKDERTKQQYALNGSTSIGIGAIAGGCDFVASYPMSPSTAVLAYLATKARQCGIVVEQAEDEIAAINMSLGAWYTGARGMVTTSGGGFALMTEGVSLAGIIESPAVIHLAQRPGPGTGLPTRTEQGDLNLAIYAGHGDFPRIIYAPGTFDDGIRLTHRAFEMADAFQVPVFVLTDQYFLDSEGFADKIDFSTMPIHRKVVKTDAGYLRYALTESGVSPRGVPGYGDGFVCVDSDEHTEEGRITEDFVVREAMVDKRMRKLSAYEDIEPEILGPADYKTLVIGWGSTYGVIMEALELLGRKDVAFAYFRQVFPLPKGTKKVLAKAKRLILVENNVTGQFGDLISKELLIGLDNRILQYNGTQFSVESLVRKLEGAMK